jgi:hypothetical protein
MNAVCSVTAVGRIFARKSDSARCDKGIVFSVRVLNDQDVLANFLLKTLGLSPAIDLLEQEIPFRRGNLRQATWEKNEKEAAEPLNSNSNEMLSLSDRSYAANRDEGSAVVTAVGPRPSLCASAFNSE